MRRVALWSVAYVFSWLVTIQFSGFGHGSYAPYAVFYSWGALPWVLSSDADKELFMFLSWPAAYWMGLFCAVRFLHGKRFAASRPLVVVLHIVGAVIAARHIEHGHLASATLIRISYGTSMALMVVFFALALHLESHWARKRAVGSGVSLSSEGSDEAGRR